MCNTNIYHNCNNQFNNNAIILFTVVGLTWLSSIIAIIILCCKGPKFTKTELEIMNRQNNESEEWDESDEELLIV